MLRTMKGESANIPCIKNTGLFKRYITIETMSNTRFIKAYNSWATHPYMAQANMFGKN